MNIIVMRKTVITVINGDVIKIFLKLLVNKIFGINVMLKNMY